MKLVLIESFLDYLLISEYNNEMDILLNYIKNLYSSYFIKEYTEDKKYYIHLENINNKFIELNNNIPYKNDNIYKYYLKYLFLNDISNKYFEILPDLLFKNNLKVHNFEYKDISFTYELNIKKIDINNLLNFDFEIQSILNLNSHEFNLILNPNILEYYIFFNYIIKYIVKKLHLPEIIK